MFSDDPIPKRCHCVFISVIYSKYAYWGIGTIWRCFILFSIYNYGVLNLVNTFEICFR